MLMPRTMGKIIGASRIRPPTFMPTMPSVICFRRSPRLYYYTLLTLLLFWITHSIVFRRSKPTTLRAGEFKPGLRRLDPSQDEAPAPLEPLGPGTMRDIREDNFYQGGTWTLTMGSDDTSSASHPSAAIYDPYPDYSSQPAGNFAGRFRACEGPRGRNLDRTNPEDMVSVYPGIQKEFPSPLIGSYEAMGLDGWVCSDRYSRLGPYGYGEDESRFNRFRTKVNWDEVNWKSLQLRCFEKNTKRFGSSRTGPQQMMHTLPSGPPGDIHRDQGDASSSPAGLQTRSRFAVILRMWDDMEWTENLKQYIRSVVMELSLHTGAEYEVFLLVHVKNNEIQIDLDDETAIHNFKARLIPAEFRDMAILFNDRTLEAWYPKIEEHGTVQQYWQVVQIFAQSHSDFDYFWPLEVDSRHMGHIYHFFDRAQAFAREQPRKYLWERNAYFYIPGAHGDWNQFMQMVDVSMEGRNSVWGPWPAPHVTNPVGPRPPVTDNAWDDYGWGVGEEADLITFMPIFDPAETQWTFPNNLWNLPLDTPRRASPVVMDRISKRLLNLVHDAQTKDGIGLTSEMTAPSFALWHGLKAVHVPQPIYLDGKWTPKELGRIMNPGPPEKISGGPDSFWNWDHKLDHIIYRMSYMFTAQTGESFVRRWLGHKPDPKQYTDGSPHQDSQGLNWYDGGFLREDLYGRLCFPPMLLHPVKNTDEKKGQGMAVPV